MILKYKNFKESQVIIKSSSSNSNSLNANTNSNNNNLVSNIPNLDDSMKRRSYTINEYDLVDMNGTTNLKRSDSVHKTTSNPNVKSISQVMMPHDKNALNFLINEYLLENSYKMTSVTFSEENESQDLEDWDVVGLNRSKPPKLVQLYKFYLNKNNLDENGPKKKEKQQQPLVNNSTETGTQYDTAETVEIGVNTAHAQLKDFETLVNFDREIFDNQHTQINKLLEKHDILRKSLAKLENEINGLNSERESHLRKIDYLTLSLDRANISIKSLIEQRQERKDSSRKEYLMGYESGSESVNNVSVETREINESVSQSVREIVERVEKLFEVRRDEEPEVLSER